MPTDHVEALLAAWNFHHDGPWTHWKGTAARGPTARDLGQVRRDRVLKGLCLITTNAAQIP